MLKPDQMPHSISGQSRSRSILIYLTFWLGLGVPINQNINALYTKEEAARTPVESRSPCVQTILAVRLIIDVLETLCKSEAVLLAGCSADSISVLMLPAGQMVSSRHW